MTSERRNGGGGDAEGKGVDVLKEGIVPLSSKGRSRSLRRIKKREDST